MSKNRILLWTAVIIFWMSLIFYLSHQPATESNQLSAGITEIIINAVEKFVPNANFDIRSVNHTIRKKAHFFAYLILGMLVINALRKSGMSEYRSIVLALGICVLYAVADEIHQLYIPGRSGEIRDFLIDSAGSGIGIGVYLIINMIKQRETRC